jgi:hypothetical protein
MKASQIPLEELIRDRYYVGRGRCANVGLWTGEWFLTVGDKFSARMKMEGYYKAEYGSFQPFRLIDEGIAIETVGTDPGWDRHYARVIEFDVPGAKHQTLADAVFPPGDEAAAPNP